MKTSKNLGYAFLAIGIAFFTLGVSGQTAFVGVGVVFFVLGIVNMSKAKPDSDNKQ